MNTAEYMRISDVAKVLGCHRGTIAKRVSEGLLPSVKFSPSPTAPRYIPTDAVRTMLQVTRTMDSACLPPGMARKHGDQWEVQYMLLNRRLGKLAEVVGRELVEAMILKHSDGGVKLLDVHPTQYGKVMRDALVLSRGLLPHAKRPDMSRIMRDHWARKRELSQAAQPAQGLGRFDALILAGEA